jgi:23S rRNA pseudouridine1911/1915/1917 synthase
MNEELHPDNVSEQEEMPTTMDLVKHVMLDFVVDKGQEPIRIDKFIITKMLGGTRSKIQQAIDDACVLVNGKTIKSNYRVRPDDHIVAYSYRDNYYAEILPENIPLKVVYEDDHILVINKPPNMVVHPGVGNFSGTVVNAAMYHFQQQTGVDTDNLPRVGLVHRIDKNTSGLLLLGKTEDAIVELSKQFKAHTVQRKYVALVWGDMEKDEGTINTFIARHENDRKIFAAYKEADAKGKHAITHYRVLERFNYVTLVECRLETGRTHQIRVHMKHIGHTLFSDAPYGGVRILKGTVYAKYKQFVENCFAIIPRQALHAKTLGFTHPATGEEMFFDSDLPRDFRAVLDKWRTYIQARPTTSDRLDSSEHILWEAD